MKPACCIFVYVTEPRVSRVCTCPFLIKIFDLHANFDQTEIHPSYHAYQPKCGLRPSSCTKPKLLNIYPYCLQERPA